MTRLEEKFKWLNELSQEARSQFMREAAATVIQEIVHDTARLCCTVAKRLDEFDTILPKLYKVIIPGFIEPNAKLLNDDMPEFMARLVSGHATKLKSCLGYGNGRNEMKRDNTYLWQMFGLIVFTIMCVLAYFVWV